MGDPTRCAGVADQRRGEFCARQIEEVLIRVADPLPLLEAAQAELQPLLDAALQ